MIESIVLKSSVKKRSVYGKNLRNDVNLRNLVKRGLLKKLTTLQHNATRKQNRLIFWKISQFYIPMRFNQSRT
jgi:hypothetical protein